MSFVVLYALLTFSLYNCPNLCSIFILRKDRFWEPVYCSCGGFRFRIIYGSRVKDFRRKIRVYRSELQLHVHRMYTRANYAWLTTVTRNSWTLSPSKSITIDHWSRMLKKRAIISSIVHLQSSKLLAFFSLQRCHNKQMEAIFQIVVIGKSPCKPLQLSKKSTTLLGIIRDNPTPSKKIILWCSGYPAA